MVHLSNWRREKINGGFALYPLFLLFCMCMYYSFSVKGRGGREKRVFFAALLLSPNVVRKRSAPGKNESEERKQFFIFSRFVSYVSNKHEKANSSD